MELSVSARMEPSGTSVMAAALGDGRRIERFEHRVEGPIAIGGDSALAAALLPAMRKGRPLRVLAPVSQRLLDQVPRIQDVFAGNGGFRRVPIEAEATAQDGPLGEGVACFFTGGVDSFYTALTHSGEITHLIYVHGFDVPRTERRLRAEVTRHLREAAGELGLSLVEVESTARYFAEPYAHWARHYHGAALASVALMLAPRFRKVYIASTVGEDQVVQYGSSPALDALWSTEQVEVVHDTQSRRARKILHVASSPVVQRHLRVCWENPGGAYNCGRCPKCTLTMVTLHLAGTLDRCETFRDGLDMERLSRLPASSQYTRGLMADYAALADEFGDREVAGALRSAYERATPARIKLEDYAQQLRASIRYRTARLRYRLGI